MCEWNLLVSCVFPSRIWNFLKRVCYDLKILQSNRKIKTHVYALKCWFLEIFISWLIKSALKQHAKKIHRTYGGSHWKFEIGCSSKDIFVVQACCWCLWCLLDFYSACQMHSDATFESNLVWYYAFWVVFCITVSITRNEELTLAYAYEKWNSRSVWTFRSNRTRSIVSLGSLINSPCDRS